ncbi:MAG: hypothetical protein O7C59_10925 [Rickettsia endosymbiont of Ixodes persulcatus]|nr:hypothetical protein [Rickettsia endosymbiont of Ixodes persulcatus]MCZ6914892.1 hypothetical protein [Rickettsia endosymbiont of Ixodes persulcatus]
MKNIFFRYNFLLFLLLLLFSPITILLLNKLFYLKLGLQSSKLSGVVKTIEKPDFGIKNFTSHTLQKYYEQYFIDNLPIRAIFIRLNNQIYYSLFKKSYNNQIIVGENGQLFELAYIYNYCSLDGPPFDKQFLINWANKIRILNDYFINKGRKFIYIITPSKAEYLAEAIPKRFHCNPHGISPHIKFLEELLRKNGIPYISGPRLMLEATNKYKTSMFPKGGTHWNYLAGGIAANEIIKKINQLGPPSLNPLLFDYQLSKTPEGTDSDLLALLNLFKPNKNYFVPILNFKPTPAINPAPTLAIIGDSFSHQYLDAFIKGDSFSKIYFYQYFRYKFEHDKNNILSVKNVDMASESIPTLNTILLSDIVILEENTLNIMSSHGIILYDLMDKLVLNNKNNVAAS